ncbi:hypothetical protein RND71_034208 [Anisodus tanguticus]|uniref:Uncharacterized protein n=1 Tax=Anisodus tanguticus TaxID=243964 RepID=A0AAE1RAV4_9SOLA|nr:hypothetical protein RND71_034208 [Anisodus tanguticus]
MSIALEMNNTNDRQIEQPGFVHGMTFVPIYKSSDLCKDDRTSSSSSSSIGRNSDDSLLPNQNYRRLNGYLFRTGGILFAEGRQLKKHDFSFKTTETGNSPGMGHSSKEPKPNNNYKTLIGDTSTIEGDDNEVTGHSPGIGHSSHNNNNIGPNV